MVDYTELKRTRGYTVNQTLDSPIMVFETWQFSEFLLALGELLIFGVVFFNWWLVLGSISFTLGGLPFLRKNFHKGYFFHFCHRRLRIPLQGLFPLKEKESYSD